jgi:hypothetical protein
MRVRICGPRDQREACAMKKFSCSLIAVALASICTTPLAAAEQAKKSAAPVLAQPKVGPTNSGPQVRFRQGQGAPSAMGLMKAAEQRKVAGGRIRSFDRDPRHWTSRDRAAWHGGHAYHGCRFDRCGNWWWADGYWYFYDYPVFGPPELVSEVAYDDQGNPAMAEKSATPPSTAVYGPGVLVAPPSAADPSTAAGAIIGGVVGGILGNALGGR